MAALENMIFTCALISTFISCILFVAFGQITVRKLRKNPKTKSVMGVEFTSGWDILNVASALSRPKWLNNRYKKSQLYFMVANTDILYETTNMFDRILAKTFWYTYIISGSSMISLCVFIWFGLIDG